MTRIWFKQTLSHWLTTVTISLTCCAEAYGEMLLHSNFMLLVYRNNEILDKDNWDTFSVFIGLCDMSQW